MNFSIDALAMPLAALAAVVLDRLLGEPRRWHPLVGFGRLAQALELSPRDAQRLAELASRERSGMGLRVARSTPRHVADLLRDIACIGQQLSPAHVRSIRQSLEVAMK